MKLCVFSTSVTSRHPAALKALLPDDELHQVDGNVQERHIALTFFFHAESISRSLSILKASAWPRSSAANWLKPSKLVFEESPPFLIGFYLLSTDFILIIFIFISPPLSFFAPRQHSCVRSCNCRNGVLQLPHFKTWTTPSVKPAGEQT